MSETINSQASPACPNCGYSHPRNYTCAEATEMEATFKFKDENPQRYRRASAFHESGHAVMAMAFGRSVEEVTIVASSSFEGGVKCDRPAGIIGSIDAARKEILVNLAGPSAEMCYMVKDCPEVSQEIAVRLISCGGRDDLETVAKLLDYMLGNSPEPLERKRLQKKAPV
jgi:hypothetical protein